MIDSYFDMRARRNGRRSCSSLRRWSLPALNFCMGMFERECVSFPLDVGFILEIDPCIL